MRFSQNLDQPYLGLDSLSWPGFLGGCTNFSWAAFGTNQFSATLGWQLHCPLELVAFSGVGQCNSHPNRCPILNNRLALRAAFPSPENLL